MYCKYCRYDLRGQSNDRCPECGEWFEPGNPKTYCLTKPVFLGVEARHIRTFLSVNLVWCVPVIVILNMNSYLPRHYDGVRSHPNTAWYEAKFRSVVKEWHIQRELDPNRSDFDLEEAETRLDGWFDRRAVRQRNEWWFWTDSELWVPWLIVSVMLLGVLRGRRQRSAMALLSILLLLGTVISFRADSIANRIWPIGYDYLREYVYVSGLNWNQIEPTTIIAYGREMWYEKSRHVAFADFHVERLMECEFRKLLAAQGLHLPEE